MEIKIIKADNGFICEWEQEYDDSINTFTKQMVFENKQEDNKGDLECFGDLAFFIKEYFGLYTNKHSKYKIDFSVVSNNND